MFLGRILPSLSKGSNPPDGGKHRNGKASDLLLPTGGGKKIPPFHVLTSKKKREQKNPAFQRAWEYRKKDVDCVFAHRKEAEWSKAWFSGHVKLKLAHWASLKSVLKFVNTVMIRSYGLARIGETGKNRSILEVRGYKTVLDLVSKMNKNNFWLKRSKVITIIKKTVAEGKMFRIQNSEWQNTLTLLGLTVVFDQR